MRKLSTLITPAILLAVLPTQALAHIAQEPQPRGASPTEEAAQESAKSEVIIRGQRSSVADLTWRRDASGDASGLLGGVSGVALQAAGGVSARPVMHGLDDERVKISVDGMDLTSACANHMNPALTYVAPSTADSIGVQAGVTPVSAGGDSLAGTITVKSAPPAFAAKSGETLSQGDVNLVYRSNGNTSGGSASVTVASDRLSFRLDAATQNASDYKDGNGEVVTSTYYKTRDLTGTLAYRQGEHLVTLRTGVRSIPGQGFANQQMDMIKNTSTFGNLTYSGTFGWGKLDAQAYMQTVHHLMNIGKDKLKLAGTAMMPDMPMNTRGVDAGAKVQAEIPLSAGTLRIGSEYHHFGLNDWWPPVAGTMMMAPDTFLNINDGRRDRTSLYAELETKVSAHWSTLAGMRADRVVSDTRYVAGYNMMYAAAASAFNVLGHKRSDTNWDAMALARYTPDSFASYEFALTRKSRAPGLYERYSWGTDWMSSLMINWAGDGNAYVGNPNLKSEVATTLLASAQWRRPGDDGWSLKLTPYYTQVEDYIDVRIANNMVTGLATINQLQFVNEAATLYGLDAEFVSRLWSNQAFGIGSVRVVASYVHGENAADKAPLYHMMPLNGRVTLEQTRGNWSNALEIEAVAKKSRLDSQRMEPATGAYALLNLYTAYSWKGNRIALSLTNALDTDYAMPLGGVSVDNFLASDWMAAFGPLKGPGRSVNLSISRQF